jgi:hypothetical protein
MTPQADTEKLEKFITDFAESGGAERANTHLFIERFCEIFDLPKPNPASEQNHMNDYVFERSILFKHADGTQTTGFIDLYKRGCFILEAKQSSKRSTTHHNPNQQELLPEESTQIKSGTAKRGTRSWDTAMLAARKQAENYARALPVEHGYPPFLLVVDIGHVIEVYADFSGQGKNYAHFPDRQSYRISLDDLREAKIQQRLRAIWTEPQTLDPTRISAEVTRDIAERLAKIAKKLERHHDAKDVAEFLMRCLFTMFAEDVGLLPEKAFTDLLKRIKDTPKNFKPALEDLWRVMDEGGYFTAFNTSLKRFNGSLFKKRHALPLETDEIHELYTAANRDWQDVEPAIFGTLLERALDKRERSKFGAHYTPRAYVERLVIPTLIEPLRTEWEEVQAHAQELHQSAKTKDAIKAVRDFHHTLCTTRVLDPACGTGNFLYVSLELMKRLEGEVLEALENLGHTESRFAMQGETVDPHQFYGLELNPRAVPIADLVLWIGYLKWQLKTSGLQSITDPVLRAYGTIKQQDAILAYDKQEELTDENGKPLTRWDGHTVKLHPITDEAIPDAEATIPLYRYVNPRSAKWPDAEYIVGNPPFIGGKDIRQELGDGYAEAIWKARPHMPGGADFVMHFWDMAATQLLTKSSKLRRFGFITTNSITQTFSRRVIERHMAAKTPLSLIYAIPDHPWMKASDKAAVRIAMTVAEKGEKTGILAKVISEADLNTDTPQVGLEGRKGRISNNLSIGADVTSANPLFSNSSLAHMGVKLHGEGFIIEPADLPQIPNYERNYLKTFVNGRDLAQKTRGCHVIDFTGLDKDDVFKVAPNLYQRLLNTVKVSRDAQFSKSSTRDAQEYAQKWWLWGKPREEFQQLAKNLSCYIATTRTARHRVFQFLDTHTVIESKVVGIASESAETLAVLSSKIHVLFATAKGGWLGVGNDSTYNHSECFNLFPFPAFSELPPALLTRLRELGEQLDSFRKERLAQHAFLTMTGLYNVLERLRELENGCDVPPLTDKEKDIHNAGLVSVLKEIHDDIDRATFEAYGWSDLIPALVGKVGATTPSSHKTPEQEAAEEVLLTRLVALNQQRAAEEKQGTIRWLRPDYQIAKLGHKTAKSQTHEQADMSFAETTTLPRWPEDGLEQIRIVRDLLAKATSPTLPDTIAASFAGRNTAKRKARVQMVLQTLVATGAAQQSNNAGYFIPKQ